MSPKGDTPEGQRQTGPAMTALNEFARLETTGLWRPEAEAQRREVVVSLGETTLIIMDGAGRPLAHWSLPAIQRLNPGHRPADYSPEPQGGETLELADDTVIDAIEKVRRSIDRRRPHPGRLRTGGSLTILAALAVGVRAPEARGLEPCELVERRHRRSVPPCLPWGGRGPGPASGDPIVAGGRGIGLFRPSTRR